MLGTLRNESNALHEVMTKRLAPAGQWNTEEMHVYQPSKRATEDAQHRQVGQDVMCGEGDQTIRQHWSPSFDGRSRRTQGCSVNHPPNPAEGRRGSLVSSDAAPVSELSNLNERTSGPVVAPSPMLASRPVSRLLPTPSSMSFPSGSSVLPANCSPSPHPSPAAQAMHFQDLQHQVSTKALALQTLQREHEHLLSAYARSKSRCHTLERKFEVSDAEINRLTEERVGLQAQVDALEAQVEGLIKSRDDARTQGAANGGQYMKIMSMASRLEAQNAADKKKWTAERVEWEKSNEEKDRRIAQLEKDKETTLRMVGMDQSPPHESEVSHYSAHIKSISPMPLSNSNSTGRREPPSLPTELSAGSNTHLGDLPGSTLSDDVSPDDVVYMGSIDDLRREVVRLRKGCHAMEVALQDLKSDGYRIEQVMQKFGNIGKRVVSKADAASHYLQRRTGAGDVGDAIDVDLVDAGTIGTTDDGRKTSVS